MPMQDADCDKTTSPSSNKPKEFCEICDNLRVTGWTDGLPLFDSLDDEAWRQNIFVDTARETNLVSAEITATDGCLITRMDVIAIVASGFVAFYRFI
ncbi:hypothetical protein GWI33_001221 [Rhynchophorus ferrugineus]|uniref:Uncharacterized protein n=1 Tax=Rhynchophorus ferrugineus TaxID=354439 RepID=A0A834MI41_RHYFE|nr:hypothetical protein GWI33_001221 [Rhynchophorus ferrugineus]